MGEKKAETEWDKEELDSKLQQRKMPPGCESGLRPICVALCNEGIHSAQTHTHALTKTPTNIQYKLKTIH